MPKRSKPIPYTEAEMKVLRDLVKSDQYTIKGTADEFRKQFPHRPDIGVQDKVRQVRREVFPSRYPKSVAKQNGEHHAGPNGRQGPGLAKVTTDLVNATDALLYAEENKEMPSNVRDFMRARAKETVSNAKKALKKPA